MGRNKAETGTGEIKYRHGDEETRGWGDTEKVRGGKTRKSDDGRQRTGNRWEAAARPKGPSFLIWL